MATTPPPSGYSYFAHKTEDEKRIVPQHRKTEEPANQ
jgi:hypothetical protein